MSDYTPMTDDLQRARIEAAMRACVLSPEIPTGQRAHLVHLEGVLTIREQVDLEVVVEKALAAADAVVTKEAHDVGMVAVDWDMVRDGVGDPQEAASIAVRAALVAAQGAAPQAERDWRLDVVPEPWTDPAPVQPSSTAPQAEAYDHCCNHPKCPGGSLCCCASEQRLRDCWNRWREEVAGNTKQAFRDAYSAGRNDPAPWAVAPALPGGVDEDKLAEVIARVTDLWDDPLDEVHDIPQITRAVAAWLKERGNATRE